MGFVYPLFLIAGLALTIPLTLHLFDLRRYKTVLFPTTRFLKDVALRSRRKRTVRQRLLLALRLLLLAALVLAFAQPYFRDNNGRTTRRISVIYVDNGPASEARTGGRTALDRATASARELVRQRGGTTYLVTAAGPAGYTPLDAAAADAALAGLRPAPVRAKSSAVWSAVQRLMRAERADAADLWWFSDFRRSAFDARPPADLTRGVALHAVVPEGRPAPNLFVDTAEVISAPEAGGETRVVVRTRVAGETPSAPPTTQLMIDGAVRSAASGPLREDGTRTDTLAFSGGSGSWQQVELVVEDGTGAAFDDTFRLAVRPVRALPVLLLHEGSPNPYLRSALAASGRFTLTDGEAAAPPADLQRYALIVLSGVTGLSGQAVAPLRAAAERGTPLVILPGRTTDIAGLEKALGSFAPLRIEGIDTATQTASALQEEAPLIRELFERVPPNVQLPAATWHYRIRSGYAASGQPIISFRNGDPLLARYTVGRGTLYLLSSGADLASGNFATSYFFPPLLYGAATEGAGAAALALTAGRGGSVFLPQAPEATQADAVAHLRAPGVDAVPPQRVAGAGLDIFPDAAVQAPGFYTITASGADTALLALNADRTESIPDPWSLAELKRAWQGGEAEWMTPAELPAQAAKGPAGAGSWPLWKISAILALLLLAAETVVLVRAPRAGTGAPAPTP